MLLRKAEDRFLLDLAEALRKSSLGAEDMGRYGEWLKVARPEFDWTYRHFEVMQAVLDDIVAEVVKRVIFEVSIRHGKTEHNTIGFAAYILERDPSTRLIVASYNDRQASKLSREIKRLCIKRGIMVIRGGDNEWETAQGGGVRAVGSGSGVASVNADGIIIDDPIGSRDEAESPAERDRVWDWLTNDLLARAEPHTWVTLTMSRWHMDDPVGRIKDRMPSQWKIVRMPGLAEKPADNTDHDWRDVLGRKEGEPLWPELRDKAWHETKLIEMGSYGCASLIQMNPVPRSGGRFKWHWWKQLKDVPKTGQLIRFWDTAGTDEEDGNDPDWTVGSLLCRMMDGTTAVVHVDRFRCSVAQRDSKIVSRAKEDKVEYGSRVKWWFETEAGVQGKDRTRALIRSVQNIGIPCYSEHATGKKESRWEPFAAAAEAGNVFLCPGEWQEDFKQELAMVPGGNHDDQADSSSGAFAKLALAPRPLGTFEWRV